MQMNLSDETKLYLEFSNTSLSVEEFRSLKKIIEREIYSAWDRLNYRLRYKEIHINKIDYRMTVS